MISILQHIRKTTLLVAALSLFQLCAFSQVGQLLWEDNFNSINTNVWGYDVGDGCAAGICGWGNAELQYYRSENTRIEAVPGESGNNALVIEAKREAFGGKSFTSARMVSKEKIAVKYGMIETRIQVPNLQTGLWPAFWMLGTSTATWPAKGEIDIMEMGHNLAERTRQGYPSSTVNNYTASNLIFYSSEACSDANPTCAASTAWDVNYDKPYVPSAGLNGKFVLYRLYWTSTSMRFTIIDNGVEYDLYESPFQITTEANEFNDPFYFLMNLAVGGTFTDATADGQVTAPLPGKMLVDYIRVYKYNNQGEIITGSTAIKESGTFGIFTDNTPTTNKLVAGVSSDIYAWNNFVAGTTAAYEGSNVIAWQTTAANTWFGGGIQTRQARDMSSFSGGNLKFRIKIPANVAFKVGITDNYTNQYYVNFPANTTTYGLVRNGEWGQATIPISALTGGIIALQSMQYMFAIVSVDGALPTSTFQIALDDIYWEGGGGVVTVPVTGVAVSPTSASLNAGGTQQLTATVSPSNATNKAVTWTSSNTAVATVNSSGLVSAVAGGSATITVRTTDGGFTATSAITVNSPQSPYSGVIAIPGTVQSENYDLGGEGVAYHDVDVANKTAAYRNDGVDIEACSEGGYNIDYSENGEWLEYTVNVATAGSYTMNVRVASPIGGTCHVEMNGTNVSGAITVPNTGGWQNWQTVTKTVTLSAGQQIMRFFIDTKEFNTNYISFANASVPVTGVSVTPTSASKAVGTTQQLTATVLPSNATDKTVTWSSSNTAVATVNSSGLVTAVAAGSATITVRTNNGGFTATSAITVTTTIVNVTGVTVTPTSASKAVGTTQQLTATVAPSNATDKTVTWSSSNTAVATVNSSGLVTAVAAGNATITVRTNNGGFTATSVITVTGGTTGTDITNLAGTITAQYTDSPANEGIAKLIDNSASTKYLTFHNAGWVQYQAPASYVVTSYTLTSANDAAERDPLNWTLQGSVNGTTWTTIDTRSGVDFPSRLQKLTFTFSNTTAYSYYRLNLTNNSGTILQLAELELFGTAASIFNTTIEAESYSSMSGIQTEATTDAGGGTNVGWIEAGDWMAYPAITIPAAGTYTIEYRVASQSGGGTLRFELAGGTPVYGTLAVPSTGGWQTWTTISHTVTLSAGSQSFAIYAVAGGWNINWFRITQGLKSAGSDESLTEIVVGSDVILYPNPVESTLNIVSGSEIKEISIVDVLGKTVYRDAAISQNEVQIEVNNLKRGVYFIGIVDESGKTIKQFIKE